MHAHTQKQPHHAVHVQFMSAPSIRDGSVRRENHLEGCSPQDTQGSSGLEFGSIFAFDENV